MFLFCRGGQREGIAGNPSSQTVEKGGACCWELQWAYQRGWGGGVLGPNYDATWGTERTLYLGRGGARDEQMAHLPYFIRRRQGKESTVRQGEKSRAYLGRF